jgi:hypothetical protein
MEFFKRAELSLGAKVLYALTRADQASMTQSLREALEEPYKVVQSRLAVYEAELAGAGF